MTTTTNDAFQIKAVGDGTVISAKGVWTIRTADRLDPAVRATQVDADTSAIMVDLTEIEVLDTTGAWLIHRFIDPKAVFKFVSEKGYRTAAGELSFGMPGADFQGHGETTTFEALIETFHLGGKTFETMARRLRVLIPMAGDTPMPPAETRRLTALLLGVTMSQPQDLQRFQRSFPILDRLYQTLQFAPGDPN